MKLLTQNAYVVFFSLFAALLIFSGETLRVKAQPPATKPPLTRPAITRAPVTRSEEAKPLPSPRDQLFQSFTAILKEEQNKTLAELIKINEKMEFCASGKVEFYPLVTKMADQIVAGQLFSKVSEAEANLRKVSRIIMADSFRKAGCFKLISLRKRDALAYIITSPEDVTTSDTTVTNDNVKKTLESAAFCPLFPFC